MKQKDLEKKLKINGFKKKLILWKQKTLKKLKRPLRQT